MRFLVKPAVPSAKRPTVFYVVDTQTDTKLLKTNLSLAKTLAETFNRNNSPLFK